MRGLVYLKCLFKSLLDVSDKILSVLKSAGEADEVGSNSGGAKLLIVHLAVGRAGGVQAAGARVSDVGFDSGDSELAHEALGGLSASLYTEGNDAAGAERHIFFRNIVVFIALKSGVLHPRDLVAGLEKLRNSKSVLTVALHADVERFKAEVEVERALRRLYGAEVAHKLSCRLRNERSSESEALCISNAVVGPGNLSLCAFQSNLPLSTIAPPTAEP